MRWERASNAVRLVCLLLAAASFGAAWRLTWVGAHGEDVPPPFTLAAGLAAIAFLCVAAIGRYPTQALDKPGRKPGA